MSSKVETSSKSTNNPTRSMSQGDIAAVKSQRNKKSRRRKKRRTADLSDSSDWDSSSASDMEIVKEDEVPVEDNTIEEKISDIELSDDESKDSTTETLTEQNKEKLANIPFTMTELTQRSYTGSQNKNEALDLKKISDNITSAKLELDNNTGINRDIGTDTDLNLQNEYLSSLFSNYGDEINSLRDSPDFSNKSLVILANVLKDGSKMFDTETLKAIVESK